jgi:hypothetical protein
LARHLGQFGEIRITRLEPETAVAWEGSAARGTVRLEPAGWGTKVFLTSTAQDAPRESEPVAQGEPEPESPALEPEPPPSEPEPPPFEPEVTSEAEPPLELEPPVRRGFFTRLRVLFGSRPAPPPPGSEPQPAPFHPTSHQNAPPAASPPAAEPTPPAASRPAAEPKPMANPLDAALDSLGSAHHRPYSRA